MMKKNFKFQIPNFREGARINSRVRCLLAVFLVSVGFGSLAAPATDGRRAEYPTFKIITERNIFNTKRSAKYVATPKSETRRPRTTEFVALTGTMRDEKGALAFFDGSSAQYRKVLKPEETIAGFKVEAVEHAYVKLKNGTNEVMLPVNMQLSREEEGDWQLSKRSESVEPAPSSSSSASVSRAASDGGGGRRGDRSRDRRGESGNNDSRGNSALGASPGTPPTAVTGEGGQTNVSDGAAATGGSEADVLERLRRQREQENN
jgi:hypothetical protein